MVLFPVDGSWLEMQGRDVSVTTMTFTRHVSMSVSRELHRPDCRTKWVGSGREEGMLSYVVHLNSFSEGSRSFLSTPRSLVLSSTHAYIFFHLLPSTCHLPPFPARVAHVNSSTSRFHVIETTAY